LQTIEDGLPHLVWAVAVKTFAHGKDYIHHRQDSPVGGPLLQECPVGPKKFPDNSLNPVSPNSSLDLAMNTDAKSIVRLVVRGKDETEIIPLNSLPFLISLVVILCFSE
jgi:hypothetical protein